MRDICQIGTKSSKRYQVQELAPSTFVGCYCAMLTASGGGEVTVRYDIFRLKE